MSTSVPTVLDVTAQALKKKAYYATPIMNWIQRNGYGKDILTLLAAKGGKSALSTFGGTGLTWYIQRNIQGAGGHIPNSRSQAQLTTAAAAGTQLSTTYDELTWRTVLQGDVIRRCETSMNAGNPAGAAKDFIQELDFAAQSASQFFTTTAAAFLLGTGDTTLANNTSSPTVTIAAAATGTILVDNVNLFIDGLLVQKLAANGTVEAAALRVITTTKGQAGSVTVTNEDSVSVDILTGGTFTLPNNAQNLAMGLQYIISDGTTSGETGYDNYPLNKSSNVSVARSSGGYSSIRGIVFNQGNAAFAASMLDQLIQAQGELMSKDTFVYNEAMQPIGNNYPVIMQVGHGVSIMQENRAIGRAFNLGMNAENNGLRKPEYNGLNLMVNQLMPPNTILCPNLNDFIFAWDEPFLQTTQTYGFFDKISEVDAYESVRILPRQLVALRVDNSAKMTNVGGASSGVTG